MSIPGVIEGGAVAVLIALAKQPALVRGWVYSSIPHGSVMVYWGGADTMTAAANCIFCNIISGTLPGEVVFRSEQVTAFKDRYPQAPVHILIVPNQHTDNIATLSDDAQLVALITAAKTVAQSQGLTDYRLITNNGQKAGQTVFHLHFHLLGGWQSQATFHLDLA